LNYINIDISNIKSDNDTKKEEIAELQTDNNDKKNNIKQL
jgi:hypothetical protein